MFTKDTTYNNVIFLVHGASKNFSLVNNIKFGFCTKKKKRNSQSFEWKNLLCAFYLGLNQNFNCLFFLFCGPKGKKNKKTFL